MKNYEKPEVEFIKFASEEIAAQGGGGTSGETNEDIIVPNP